MCQAVDAPLLQSHLFLRWLLVLLDSLMFGSLLLDFNDN